MLYGYNDTGKNENIDIFNSTPKWCSNARANKLHSLLLPINKRWGTVHSTDVHDGSDVFEAEYTNRIFDAIDKSNLHSVAKSFFLDLNIGCAALWIDSPSKEKPVQFKNIPGITLMPELSADPEESNVWFKRVINWRDLNKLNPEMAKNKDITGEYHITAGYLDMRETHEKYCYIQFLDDNFTEPLSIEWSDWRQLVLVNETLRPGEARGHGIILQILEEIQYLNDISGSLKQYIQYSANPDLVVPDTMPGNFGDTGGNIYPTDLAADGRMVVQPIQWQINIPAVSEMIEQLEQKIRQFFNVMPLGLPENTPHATATEVGYRQADEERQSVADLSRVANETLGGIMKTTFDILVHRGIIQTDGEHFQFKFDSPAVDIQAQENLNAILQLAEMSTQVIGEGAPSIYMNPQNTFNELVKNLRTPDDISNTPDQVKQVLSTMQQAAQNQQQAQQQGQQQSGGGQQPQLTPQPLSPGTPIDPAQLGKQTGISGIGM